MSSFSDNPLARFSAFVWGISIFLLFVVGLTVLYFFNREDPVSLEDSAAAKRYETKAKVFAAQDAALGYKEIEAGKKVQVPPHDVFDLVGKKLASTKAAATTTVVPGSKTETDLQNQANQGGAVDYKAIDAMGPKADAPIDPALLAAGKTKYEMYCATCHSLAGDGKGGPAAPPHAGSEWVTGPVSNLVRIQFRGLTGPIHVKGEVFSLVPMMAGLEPLLTSDDDVAALSTYIRNSFGNKASAVSPEQVKLLRAAEKNKPSLTEADLIKP